MSKHVIDSYAWIEYFIGSEKGERVKDVLMSHSDEVFIPEVVIAEVVSITAREKRDVEQAYKGLLSFSKIFDSTPDFAKEVGLLHAEMRETIKDFGLADTFVLLTAKKLNAQIVTGDPHFKGLKNVVFL